jgi:hypothetical protein
MADFSALRKTLYILIDERKSLRIVDATGWDLDALRREYQASTVYTVKGWR